MSLNKSEHENHRIPQDAQIAQLVEQRTENPRVTGSIPVLGIFYLNFKKVSALYGAETFFGG